MMDVDTIMEIILDIIILCLGNGDNSLAAGVLRNLPYVS